MRARRLTTLALASVALTAFAACGGDDDDASVASEACDAAVAYGAAVAQQPQDPAEFGAFATDQLVPIADTLVAHLDNQDGADREAAVVLRDALMEVGNTGDPTLLEGEGVATAIGILGRTIHEGCDLQAVDIEAVDYRFENAPTELDAGRVSFALTNTGVEDHEMVLFKAADGVTETLDELLALPEEEGMAKLQFTGVAFGGPGTTNYVAMDLDPGTYFLVCFLPVGGAEGGMPHFMSGMQSTLTVA